MTIEFDDGKSPKAKTEPNITRRGRLFGFYVINDYGKWFRVPVGFMRVSEMAALLNLLQQDLNLPDGNCTIRPGLTE